MVKDETIGMKGINFQAKEYRTNYIKYKQLNLLIG